MLPRGTPNTIISVQWSVLPPSFNSDSRYSAPGIDLLSVLPSDRCYSPDNSPCLAASPGNHPPPITLSIRPMNVLSSGLQKLTFLQFGTSLHLELDRCVFYFHSIPGKLLQIVREVTGSSVHNGKILESPFLSALPI